MLKDPPFIKQDLIACRNLLIYLQRDIQTQLCALFHYALKPGGFLLLGSAETAEIAGSMFDPVDREARLYSARELPGQSVPSLVHATTAGERRHVLPHLSYIPQYEPRATLSPPSPHAPGLRQLHSAQLEQHAPPSVLVDNAYRALHFSSTAGRFCMVGEGPPNADLTTMVPGAAD